MTTTGILQSATPEATSETSWIEDSALGEEQRQGRFWCVGVRNIGVTAGRTDLSHTLGGVAAGATNPGGKHWHIQL